MAERQIDHIVKYRRALEELHANRHQFTADALGPLVLTLNQALRKAATLPRNNLVAPDAIRLVTVLFVDVSDSTRIARQMDASDWKLVLAQAHQQVADVVTAWDGEVGQYLGDGLLCYFGAQRSGGDDASRAVACALAIQNTVEAYAKSVYTDYKVTFTTRIGVTTGRLVVGMVGYENRQTLLALGPATNLAARLQSFALPGQVLIDSTTFSRVRRQFICDAVRPIQVKGYDEAIRSYQVIGQRSPEDILFVETSVNGIELPFVGRQGTIETLQRISDEARQKNELQFVTLIGDAGLGKSRLLQELKSLSEDQPVRPFPIIATYEKRGLECNLLRHLLMSECHITDDMPLEVIQEHIRAQIGGVWLHETEAIIAAETIGYLAGYGFEDSEHIRMLARKPAFKQQAYSWVAQWLQVLAGDKSILLLIDNILWADAESYEWLRNLLMYLKNSPTCMIIAIRTGEANHALDNLAQTQDRQNVILKPLAVEEIKQIADAVLQHVKNAPRQLTERICERSQGNPLFVTESLTMLFDSGVFQQGQDDLWRVDVARYEDAIAAMPHGLLGILQARLDELMPEAYAVIQIAAIIGDTFWEACVRELLKVESVSMALQELEARGFITLNDDSAFSDDRQYSFRQSLYRQVAYEMVPRALRESYHNQVAQWLILRVATRPELYTALAEHFEAANRHEAALFTYLEVAQNRYERNMLQETLAHVQRGLALTGKVAREEALPVASQLWLLQGRALNGLGRHAQASAACESALMLFDEMPGKVLNQQRTIAARTLGSAYRCMGRYDKSFDALQMALETIDKDNGIQYSKLLMSFGILALYRGYIDEALTYQARSEKIGKDSQSISAYNGALTLRGLIAIERGELGLALRAFQQVLESNSEFNFIHYMIKDLFNIGTVYMGLKCYERALLVFDEAELLIQQHRGHRPLLQAYRGLTLMELGHLEEGSAQLQMAQEMQPGDTHQHQMLQLASLRGMILTGDYEACIQNADIFIESVRHTNELMAVRATHRKAQAYQKLGRLEEARMQMATAMSVEEISGGRRLWECYVGMAELSPLPQDRLRYMTMAAEVLTKLAESLNEHPGLKHTFLQGEMVRSVFQTVADGTIEET